VSFADPRELAVAYLLATRRDTTEAAGLEQELAAVSPSELRRTLADDASRHAFWIDVYNGTVLRHQGFDTADAWARLRHFRRAIVTVAGQPLSLDGIEHGILRRSRWKLGLGYLGNPLPSRFERTHRVDRVDPRIHFALNCGALSCPPIAAYRSESINDQLDLATRSNLATEVMLERDVIAVPAILLWYAGDFGGAPGIRRLLRQHGVEGWNRRIRFRKYDWTSAPDRWAADES